MDFTPTEEQRSVEQLAQKMFSEQVNDDYLKAWQDDQPSFDGSLWKMIGDAGLIGVTGSADHGGIDLGFLELIAILEAQGSVLAGLPLYQSIVVAQVIEEFAIETTRQALLPPVFAGDGHFALGLEGAAREGLGTPLQSDGKTLSGAVSDVAFAAGASAILVAVALYEKTPNQNGKQVALYLLDPAKDSLSFEQQDTTYRHAHYRISFDQLNIDPERLFIGPEVLESVLQRSYVALAALQLGVVEAVLQRTAQYTIERQQFGKAIASFQAVSHRAADGYVDCAALRACVLQAAWRLSEGLDATTEARSAKWWATEAGHRISHTAQHLHGGIGSDLDYPIHRYFRWAKQIEFTLGGGQEQLAQLGRLLAENSELGIVV
ncbi:MAG: acyl-CoA dehydrogenase family protein [Pseudomonadales bacterium]